LRYPPRQVIHADRGVDDLCFPGDVEVVPTVALDPKRHRREGVFRGIQVFKNNVILTPLWDPRTETAAVVIIPPFIVNLVGQKQIIETFVNSDLKGSVA
jgi:hypothetical protein